MEKQEAKKALVENGRYNFTVEYTKEICDAFGVEFDDSLILTEKQYRENIEDGTEPRVNCCSLSRFVCKALGKKPNEKKYVLASRFSGAGSWRDAESQAWAMDL